MELTAFRRKKCAPIAILFLIASALAFYACLFVIIARAGRDCAAQRRAQVSGAQPVASGGTPSVSNAGGNYAAVFLPPPPPLKRTAKDRMNALDEVIRACGLHPALVHSVINAESGGNPRARSRRGAAGLMQITPATARQLRVRNVFDPAQNVTAGSTYLRQLLDRYDNKLELALAAYNAGPSRVDAYGAIPPYPETRRYVQRILRDYHRALTQID